MVVENHIKNTIVIAMIALLLAISLNYKVIPSLIASKQLQLMIPEATKLYFKIIGGRYTWDEFLSETQIFRYLSYRAIILLLNRILNFSTSQLAITERVVIQFISFLGAYLLVKKYLIMNTYKNERVIELVSALGGLLYSINPSFIIGDSSWLNIEFAYASLPWIVWSFNKVVLDKKWKYAIICAFLMATNIDQHSLYAGFPIFLSLYSGFIFLSI